MRVLEMYLGEWFLRCHSWEYWCQYYRRRSEDIDISNGHLAERLIGNLKVDMIKTMMTLTLPYIQGSHTERSSKLAYPSGPISTLNVFLQWWSAALVALYEAILKTSRPSSLGYLQRTGHPPATSAAHLHPYMYGTIPPTEPILTIAPFALDQ